MMKVNFFLAAICVMVISAFSCRSGKEAVHARHAAPSIAQHSYKSIPREHPEESLAAERRDGIENVSVLHAVILPTEEDTLKPKSAGISTPGKEIDSQPKFIYADYTLDADSVENTQADCCGCLLPQGEGCSSETGIWVVLGIIMFSLALVISLAIAVDEVF